MDGLKVKAKKKENEEIIDEMDKLQRPDVIRRNIKEGLWRKYEKIPPFPAFKTINRLTESRRMLVNPTLSQGRAAQARPWTGTHWQPGGYYPATNTQRELA